MLRYFLPLLLLSTPALAGMCGDMDGNGQITVTDGVNVLRAAAELPFNANCEGVPVPTSTPVQQPTAHATPIQTSPLAFLLGTWNFTYTLTSQFTDTYRFQQLSTSNSGKPIVLGVNQFDGPFLCARLKDLSPTTTLTFEFGLLDNQGTLCEFHIFDRLSDTAVSGEVTFMLTDTGGNCDPDTLFPVIQPMSGSKTSSVANIASARAQATALARMATARAEAILVEVDGSQDAHVASDGLEEFRAQIRALQDQ